MPPETLKEAHLPPATPEQESQLKKIVLVGNPNVGKSTVFYGLSGVYAEVSNFPGTTVSIAKTRIQDGLLIDSPGIYGVSSFTEEEKVAKNVILDADIIINVVSAISLERDLFLTQHLIDLDLPVIVALNQFDETAIRGIQIDTAKLEAELGIPVIPTIATKNTGIPELLQAITTARTGIKCLDLNYVASKYENIPSRELLLALEGNSDIQEKYQLEIEKDDSIYTSRRKRVNHIVEQVVHASTTTKASLGTTLGRLILNPVYGLISATIVLFALYQVLGVWVAGDLVDFLENNIMNTIYVPWIQGIVNNFIHQSSLQEVLVGEFGVLTMTVVYTFGVLLPLVISFYIMLSILEDSGYIPRMAVLTDRTLNQIGLNGRAIVPIMLGFGCVTMATITTRILGTERERTIATSILGLAIPCSAQLGIIFGLLAIAGGLKAWLIYGITMFIVLVAIGTILHKVLPGESSSFIIDLPPLRFPQLSNVFKKTYNKSITFLKEAIPLFFLGSLAISIMLVTGFIDQLENILGPFLENIVKLPKETAIVFIMGLIRRDFGAAGLLSLAGAEGATQAILSVGQIISSLVIITLFVPCIATVMILFKERGTKQALILWLGSFVVAFGVGAILCNLLTTIGI